MTGQDLLRTYLARHELESDLIIIIRQLLALLLYGCHYLGADLTPKMP